MKTMRVRGLIKKLMDYNLDAEIMPVAHNKEQSFSLSFGTSDGCKKESCNKVFIDCDELNKDEGG